MGTNTTSDVVFKLHHLRPSSLLAFEIETVASSWEDQMFHLKYWDGNISRNSSRQFVLAANLTASDIISRLKVRGAVGPVAEQTPSRRLQQEGNASECQCPTGTSICPEDSQTAIAITKTTVTGLVCGFTLGPIALLT